MPLTSEVRRSPEPSARPSAAADSEERQICTTCLFAESVGLCLCFLPSCAMYKDNAVANVVAEMGRELVSTTARLSDLSMPLKGEIRRSPEQSTPQPIARSGKFVQRAYSRRALDCAYAFCYEPHGTRSFRYFRLPEQQRMQGDTKTDLLIGVGTTMIALELDAKYRW